MYRPLRSTRFQTSVRVIINVVTVRMTNVPENAGEAPGRGAIDGEVKVNGWQRVGQVEPLVAA